MEYPILRYVDMLIGFAGVMLLAATVVIATTHLFVSTFYFRSRALRLGLTDMIRQIDPSVLTAEDARYLSELILRHPAFGRPTARVGRLLNWLHNEFRTRVLERDPLPPTDPGDVIQRSELMVALLELASGQGPLLQGTENLPPEAIDRIQGLNFKLRKALVANGIDDPKATLQAVRLQAVENEKNRPELPAHHWWTHALLEHAASDFAGKMTLSFDNTMDRVSKNFKLKANSIATVTAGLIVFSLQLDSIALLSRLGSDDRFRETLVRESEMWGQRYEEARVAQDQLSAPPPSAAAAPPPQPAAPAAAPEARSDGRTDARNRRNTRKSKKRAEVRNEPKLVVVAPAPAPAPVAQQPPKGQAAATEKEQIEEDLRRARTARREIDDALEILRQPRYAIIPDKVPYLDSTVFWKPGVWLSFILLSLGAPFWFNVLRTGLRFRSTLAGKDDMERAERSSEFPPLPEEKQFKARGAGAG